MKYVTGIETYQHSMLTPLLLTLYATPPQGTLLGNRKAFYYFYADDFKIYICSFDGLHCHSSV